MLVVCYYAKVPSNPHAVKISRGRTFYKDRMAGFECAHDNSCHKRSQTISREAQALRTGKKPSASISILAILNHSEPELVLWTSALRLLVVPENSKLELQGQDDAKKCKIIAKERRRRSSNQSPHAVFIQLLATSRLGKLPSDMPSCSDM